MALDREEWKWRDRVGGGRVEERERDRTDGGRLEGRGEGDWRGWDTEKERKNSI